MTLTILKATGAIGIIEGVQSYPTPEPTGELVKLIIQVAVGLATIYSMLFKKKKE